MMKRHQTDIKLDVKYANQANDQVLTNIWCQIDMKVPAGLLPCNSIMRCLTFDPLSCPDVHFICSKSNMHNKNNLQTQRFYCIKNKAQSQDLLYSCFIAYSINIKQKLKDSMGYFGMMTHWLAPVLYTAMDGWTISIYFKIK